MLKLHRRWWWMLTVVVAGCNWFTSLPPNPPPPAVLSSPDGNVPPEESPAAGLATGSIPLPQASNGSTHKRNPLRDLADPYLVVGRSLPEWKLEEWAHGEPATLESLRGRVVVVRFWTDRSPPCERTMRALQLLADEFRNAPVTIIGAYQFEGEANDEPSWEDVLATARPWRVTFPLAYDRRRLTLNLWWIGQFDNLPTTPTFVIRPDGRVAYVHPGPEFFPSSDPLNYLCNEDYQAIRAAVRGSISQNLAESRTAP